MRLVGKVRPEESSRQERLRGYKFGKCDPRKFLEAVATGQNVVEAVTRHNEVEAGAIKGIYDGKVQSNECSRQERLSFMREKPRPTQCQGRSDRASDSGEQRFEFRKTNATKE